MKETASFTASFIAVARGLARVLPVDARLVEDPFGERFSTGRLLAFVRRHAQGFLLPVIEPVLLTVQVRTKLLDEALLSFVHRGGRQVVLLGAGFDARALRLDAVRRFARVFEIDHPATQAAKRAHLEAPPHIAYVPLDFETVGVETLPEVLARAGHDASAPTFVLWEGVTMYLSEAAVDATVRAVSGLCDAGSSFVFTYFERAAIKAPSFGARLVGTFVRGVGEPLTFGFDSAALAAWLHERGFSLDHDVSVSDAGRMLLPARYAHHFRDQSLRVAFATKRAAS